MIDHQTVDVEPTLHNAKDKYRVLDWSKLPAIPCELNYRLTFSHTEGLRSTALAICITAIITVMLRLVLALGPAEFLVQRSSGTMLAMVALICAAGCLWRMTMADVVKAISSAIAIFAIGFVLLIIARGKASLVAAMFVGFSPCAIGLLADQMATHFAYWMTANPRVPRSVMLGWRGDWNQRFVGMSDRPSSRSQLSNLESKRYLRALKLRRTYPFGFGVLLACFAVAAMGTGCIAYALGGQHVCVLVVINSTIVVLFAAVAQAVVLPASTTVFTKAISSYFIYGRDDAAPPWVFQSPSGSGLTRKTLLVATATVLALLAGCLVTSQGIMPFQSYSLQRNVGGVIFVTIIVPIVCTPLLLLLGSFLAIGPTLLGYYEALERDGAAEHPKNWSDFDGYVHRLQTSSNPIERRSNIVGFHPIWGFPILADTDLYFEHQHVLGATGSGKTALSVTTDVIQLIRRNDGAVIVIDCKGDRALLETCRLEAAAAGRKFKWFTNKPNHSTYIFNPLAHLSCPEFTLPEVLGVLLQSFNLFHGEEYGRAYFGKAVRVLLRAAFLATVPEGSSRRGFDRHTTGYRAERIESLWDLDEILHDIAANDREYEAAKHLTMLVASLCDFDQLNLTASRNPHEPAARHAISMPEVIDEKQVAYFYLVGTMDAASVGEIARLALFSANSAAVQHRDRTGERARIHLIADEAQCLLASNVETVLQQARDSGIGFLLAHQSLSQLKLAGGVDLTSQVMNSTCIKRYHSARDATMQKYISEISGTTKYYSRTWKQFKHRVLNGDVSSRYACTDADGVMRIDVAEAIGPRLEPEDIRDINRDINKSIVIFERNSGYAQFQGAFPMVTQWPTELGRDKQAWPTNEKETITISGAWPDANDETVNSPSPVPRRDLSPGELDEKLRELMSPGND